MSGCAHFDRYNICAKQLCRRSASVWDSLFAPSAVSKRLCATGVDDSPFKYSEKIIKHISNIINHIKFHFTWRGVVDVHTNVFVYSIPCGGHF